MIEIFSYWIFFWFILYYLGLTKYNPLFILIIGYIITIIEVIYLLFTNISRYNLIKFIIINILIKLIPILIIIKTSINKNDIYMSFLIFSIYLIYMYILRINPYIFYKKLLNTYINNDIKNRTIFSKLYDYIYIKIIK